MTRGRFRILSLDGGGVRGAYSAAVLAEVEEGTGRRVVDHFDLIAGTSTGGIIAIALGLGLTAREILEFYQNKGSKIFPSMGIHQRLWARVRRVVASKYSDRALNDALTEVFDGKLLGDSKCRLLIPSYDAVAGDVHVFKTRHDKRVLKDHTRSAVEVARATSAAPTYLPMFRGSWGQRFLDGGVWANCPAGTAVLEALAVLNVPLEDIHMLSIGTTAEAFSIDKQAAGGGLLQYRLDVIDLLQQAQTVGGYAQARLLLRDRMLRVNSTVQRNRFSLDDARGLDALVALGLYEGRHRALEIGERFLDAPVAPFVPVP